MFHVYWPASAALALFVVIVIVLILRFSDKWCGARHSTLPTAGAYESTEDMEMVAYDHSVNTEKEFSV
jgi:hypothetical protein